MNVNKLLGLIMTTKLCKPHEALAGLQSFIDELNNCNIESFVTIEYPDTLITPLYQLDIPSNVKTIKTVYDGIDADKESIDQTYTEQRHMINDRVGIAKECYVDKSGIIVFGYGLTQSILTWSGINTGNAWTDNGNGRYDHVSDNTLPWTSNALGLMIGSRNLLTYTIGEGPIPEGNITSITIGGVTLSGTYLIAGTHTLEIVALSDAPLVIQTDNIFDGYVSDLSLISQTSNIVCKATVLGINTISTANEKYEQAARHYALSFIYRMDKYKNEKEAVNHYNEYENQMNNIKDYPIDITPSDYGSKM